MNSITTRRALTDKIRFAGRNWYYDFRELVKAFDEGRCGQRAANLSTQFSNQLTNWSDEFNSEWICRHYLAGKMVLAATVQLTSRKYAQKHNVRVVDAYLAYYALLSLSRAVVLTLPNVPWDGGRIVRLSHTKLRNLTVDAVRYFDTPFSVEVQSVFDHARASRELISYWHPSSGAEGIQSNERLIEICTLLAEIAQFNSEILEASCHKRKIFGFTQAEVIHVAPPPRSDPATLLTWHLRHHSRAKENTFLLGFRLLHFSIQHRPGDWCAHAYPRDRRAQQAF